MGKLPTAVITKSDYRCFRDAPLHLWAKKNNRLEMTAGGTLAAIQGDQVECLAKTYIESFIISGQQGWTLSWQTECSDGPYYARADALVSRTRIDSVDLYEIKSSTKVKPEDVEDAAFQTLIFKQHYHIEHINLLLVNNTYIYQKELDLAQALKVEDITEQVTERNPARD